MKHNRQQEIDDYFTFDSPQDNKPSSQYSAPNDGSRQQEIDDYFTYDSSPAPDANQFEMSPERQAKLSNEMSYPTSPKTDYSVRGDILSEGAKKGVGDLASMGGVLADRSVELKNQLYDNLPPDVQKLMGTRAVKPKDNYERLARKGWKLLLDGKDITPKNEAEKYAYKAAQFVGSGLPFTARMMVKEAGQLIEKGLSKPAITKELGKTLGVDLTSGVTGGVSAQYWGDIVSSAYGEENRWVGDLLGGVGGGAAPYYAANLTGGAKNVKTLFTDSGNRQGMMENVAKDRIEAAIGESPRSAGNLERSQQLQQKMEGFNPNLAAAADSEGLSMMQRNIDARNVENYNRSEQMIAKSNESIDAYYRKTMPTLNDELMPFIKERYSGVVDTAGRRISAIDKKRARLKGSLEANSPAVAGKRLRELKEQAHTDAKNLKDLQHARLIEDAKKNNVEAEVSDIRAEVDSILKEDASAFADLPSVYQKILRVIPEDRIIESPILTPAGAPAATETLKPIASFEVIDSLLKEVRRQSRIAKDADKGKNSYFLDRIKKVVESKMDGFDSATEYGSFAQHKRAVDASDRENYYSVFKQGLGARINKTTKIGDRSPDEEVVKKFVLGRGSDGIKQFNRVYQNIPEAQGLLKSGVMDALTTKIKDSGFTQETIDNFLSKNRYVFDELPGLRGTLSDTGRAVEALSRRKIELENFQKRIVNDNNNIHAKAAGFDDIEDAVASSFKNKDVARLLMRAAKTDTQKQNLATGFADYVIKQNKPWEYLANNEKLLKPIFNRLGAGHYNNLKDVSEAMQIMGRYQLPAHLAPMAGGGDPLKRYTDTSVVSAFAQMRFAFFYGKTSAVYPFVDIGSKFLFKQGREAIDRLIEKSMYDPDLAKTLSNLTKRKEMPLKVWRSLSEKMLGVRVRAAASAAGEPSLNDQFNAEVQ